MHVLRKPDSGAAEKPMLVLALIALFVLLPAAEIATFIVVGGWIGVIPTILLVFATAIAGAALMRHQGLGTITRLQAEMDAGRVPGETLGDGAMILSGGILLLVPGFLTDLLGLLLFLPPVRHLVWRLLSRRMRVTVVGGRGGPRPGRVVDLEPDAYRRTEPGDGRLPGESPWRPDAER